jgi:hypothetical protein
MRRKSGSGRLKSILMASSIAARADRASGTGFGLAVPAGTLFYAEVDGEQKVRVSRAAMTNKKPRT